MNYTHNEITEIVAMCNNYIDTHELNLKQFAKIVGIDYWALQKFIRKNSPESPDHVTKAKMILELPQEKTKVLVDDIKRVKNYTQYIKSLLKEKGIPQTELCVKLAMPLGVVADIINGYLDITPEFIDKLSATLMLTMAQKKN